MLIFFCICINHSQDQEIKGNSKLNFTKKLLGELIFLWATKNLKMFYFNRSVGGVLKK